MILNRQHRIRIPLQKLRRFLARVQRQLQTPAGSLTVCLVSNAQISRWNRAYRGREGPTDVLSFPAEQEQTRRRRHLRRGRTNNFKYLGDIAVAPEVAWRNARIFGRTFEDEMRILILHGILHLLGYDHETDAGQMDRRECRLRRKFGLA
jgi:probable rRNA maturation factor